MFSSSLTRTIVSTAGAALFATICLTAATAPAAAQVVTSSKIVSYAGLDLNSERGRAVLDARIRAAAKSVCNTNSNDLRSRLHESRCIRTAIAQATRS